MPGQGLPLRGSSQSLNRTLNLEARMTKGGGSQSTLDSDSHHGSGQDVNDGAKFDQVCYTKYRVRQ